MGERGGVGERVRVWVRGGVGERVRVWVRDLCNLCND